MLILQHIKKTDTKSGSVSFSLGFWEIFLSKTHHL